MDEIIVQTKLDSKVYSEYSRFHNFTYGHRSLTLGVFPILMIGFAIMNGLSGSWILCVLFVLLGILMPVGYLIFYQRGVSNQIKRFGLEQKKLVYTVILDAVGLHVDMGKELANYPWENIYGAYRVPSYIYVYVTKTRSFILPDDAIQQGENANTLWSMIFSHMGMYRTKSYLKK